MKALDHDTFHAMEIDALFDELDAEGSSAIREHAARCESCAARFARLRRTRQRGLSVLAEAVPEDFESRIMAAVDAALAKRSGGPALVPKLQRVPDAGASEQASKAKPARVTPFFTHPGFAVAATLVLVVGAAAVLSQTAMSKRAAPMASSADQSAAVAAAAATLEQNEGKPGAPGAVAATPEAAEEALAKARSRADQPNVVALQEDPFQAPAGRALGGAAPPPPPAAPAKAAKASAATTNDPAFSAALALYNQGRYAEARPKFDALRASNPEADLYAARCIAKTSGCQAAAPRFDAIAQRNSGTVVGSRAQLEAGACYRQMNQLQAARSRFEAAKNEGHFAAEASSDLDSLDAKSAGPAAPLATTSPGAAGGSKASPKSPARPSEPAKPVLDENAK